MDPTSVYAKTDLGQEEIDTRVRRIPARMRTMLIMVDGRHSIGELLANHPTPDEARGYLESLLEGGFIAPREAPVAPAPVAVPAATAAAGAASATAVTPDLGEAKQVITRMLIDFLGPEADYLALRVEKLSTRDELLAEVEKLSTMLVQSVSSNAASRFREAVLPLLG